MLFVWDLINRICEKWFRFYRRKCFEAYTKQKCPTLKILGKIYVRNRNIIVGDNVTLYPGVMLHGDGNICIGSNTFIGNNTVIYAGKDGGVKIGEDCMIAALCHIIDTDHKFEGKSNMNMLGVESKKIIIEDDVWLASNVTVLKGSNIHKGVVLGAKSLIKDEAIEYGIYVGVPAKLVKKRF